MKHPAYGDGVVIGLDVAAYKMCFMHYGVKHVGKEYNGWEIIEALEPEEVVTFNEAEKSLVKILRAMSDISEIVPLGDRWKGGNMLLQPEDKNLKPKEMPIEAFFHKIVMVRDRLRVMIQRINASRLEDEVKVNLQQYITRIYGCLISVNVLFKNK